MYTKEVPRVARLDAHRRGFVVAQASAMYLFENKGYIEQAVIRFGLRKSRFEGRIHLVRRSGVFLQNGTSARLAAPLICMPAPEYAGRYKCLEERSLRRVRFSA